MKPREYGTKGLEKRLTPEELRKRDKQKYRWRSQGIDMTSSKYDEQLASQDGKCRICKRPPKKRKLSVDHDHKTGKVRGLLCWKCNYQLIRNHRTGWIFRRAADYLDGTL